MRFLLIDTVDEYRPNEYLRGQVVIPRTLIYPAGRPDRDGPAPSLLLESLAQAGGWLIKATRDFRVLGVMSVISGYRLHRDLPRHGPLTIEVWSVPGTARLVGVRGTLSTPSGEVVATVDSILYVLIPTEEGSAHVWGVQAWKVLTERRRLAVQEDAL